MRKGCTLALLVFVAAALFPVVLSVAWSALLVLSALLGM